LTVREAGAMVGATAGSIFFGREEKP